MSLEKSRFNRLEQLVFTIISSGQTYAYIQSVVKGLPTPSVFDEEYVKNFMERLVVTEAKSVVGLAVEIEKELYRVQLGSWEDA